MLSQAVQEALNDQVHAELTASYNYLGMAASLREMHLHGVPQWMQSQSNEEYGHAMKLFGFLTGNGCKVVLKAIDQPASGYKSVREIFETSLEQEIEVSARIDSLYELTLSEKAFAASVELQWFVTEQLEEERTCRGIISRLKMVESDPAALLELDAKMGARP